MTQFYQQSSNSPGRPLAAAYIIHADTFFCAIVVLRHATMRIISGSNSESIIDLLLSAEQFSVELRPLRSRLRHLCFLLFYLLRVSSSSSRVSLDCCSLRFFARDLIPFLREEEEEENRLSLGRTWFGCLDQCLLLKNGESTLNKSIQFCLFRGGFQLVGAF